MHAPVDAAVHYNRKLAMCCKRHLRNTKGAALPCDGRGGRGASPQGRGVAPREEIAERREIQALIGYHVRRLPT